MSTVATSLANTEPVFQSSIQNGTQLLEKLNIKGNFDSHEVEVISRTVDHSSKDFFDDILYRVWQAVVFVFTVGQYTDWAQTNRIMKNKITAQFEEASTGGTQTLKEADARIQEKLVRSSVEKSYNSYTDMLTQLFKASSSMQENSVVPNSLQRLQVPAQTTTSTEGTGANGAGGSASADNSSTSTSAATGGQ